MSKQPDPSSTVQENDVARYLIEHPDFFTQHQSILQEIVLSHDCGAASSLLEKQITLLKQQNRHYLQQLQKSQQKAVTTEQLYQQLSALTQALLDGNSLEQFIETLKDALIYEFNIDASYLVLTNSAKETLYLPDEQQPCVWQTLQQFSHQPLPNKLLALFFPTEYQQLQDSIVIPLTTTLPQHHLLGILILAKLSTNPVPALLIDYLSGTVSQLLQHLYFHDKPA